MRQHNDNISKKTNEQFITSPYWGNNQSAISFETIETTERLLDKLDLSLEDEEVLQQAVMEEEENSRLQVLRSRQTHKVSMPANSFLSLRHNKNVSREKNDVKPTFAFSNSDSNIRMNKTNSDVKQHTPSTSRYSYIAEESSDLDEDLNKSSMKMINDYSHYSRMNDTVKSSSRNNDHNSNNSINHNNYNKATSRQPDSKSKLPRGVINIERYRFRNKNYRGNSLLTNLQAEKDKTATNRNINSNSFWNYVKSNDKNNNSTLRNTEINQQIQIEMSNNDSSLHQNIDSNLGSANNLTSLQRISDKNEENLTPKKAGSSRTLDSAFIEEVNELGSGNKGDKKKSKFLIKNLFRSPKAGNSNSQNEVNNNFTKSPRSTILNSSNRSAETEKRYKFSIGSPMKFNSRSQNSQTIDNEKKIENNRRSAELFEYSASPQTKKGEDSGIHNTSFNYSTPEAQSTNYFESNSNNNNSDDEFPRVVIDKTDNSTSSLASTDSEVNDTQSKTLQSDMTSFNFDNNDEPSIELALKLRAKGDFVESSNVLRKCCMSGKKAAFLLYGLALRYGYGVQINHKESFHYIMEATGVKSVENEIFAVLIDPIELERKSDIPKTFNETITFALYECGLSYVGNYEYPKQDEIKALKFFEKAASLGHVDSMCLSGTIWSKSSFVRERNLVRAAAWFRLAKERGANLIGSDWIYKPKYLNI